jgi:hypothetical protein
MEKYNKICFNMEQNLLGIQASSGSDDPQPVASEFTSIGNGTPLLADAIIDGGADDPQPVVSEFTSIGNGTPLLADAIIDGGSSGGGDAASPDRRTSRGVVAGNSGNCSAFSDGFGDLLPSGLISDIGDEAFFKAGRNKSVSNASGNLLVPDSGTDPFTATLATLI